MDVAAQNETSESCCKKPEVVPTAGSLTELPHPSKSGRPAVGSREGVPPRYGPPDVTPGRDLEQSTADRTEVGPVQTIVLTRSAIGAAPAAQGSRAVHGLRPPQAPGGDLL